jgi:hypothetical protein
MNIYEPGGVLCGVWIEHDRYRRLQNSKVKLFLTLPLVTSVSTVREMMTPAARWNYVQYIEPSHPVDLFFFSLLGQEKKRKETMLCVCVMEMTVFCVCVRVVSARKNKNPGGSGGK